MPPWLPPFLWLAGGGTLGSGMGFFGSEMKHQEPEGQESCEVTADHLREVTLEFAQYVAECQCEGESDAP